MKYTEFYNFFQLSEYQCPQSRFEPHPQSTHTAFEKAMRQPSKLRCAELFTQELFPHGKVFSVT